VRRAARRASQWSISASRPRTSALSAVAPSRGARADRFVGQALIFGSTAARLPIRCRRQRRSRQTLPSARQLAYSGTSNAIPCHDLSLARTRRCDMAAGCTRNARRSPPRRAEHACSMRRMHVGRSDGRRRRALQALVGWLRDLVSRIREDELQGRLILACMRSWRARSIRDGAPTSAATLRRSRHAVAPRR